MTKASGSFGRVAACTVLMLAATPSLARAQLQLATAVAPRYASGGVVKCSVVNIGAAGDDSLDVTVSLIDVGTGDVEELMSCTGDPADPNPGAVPPGQRCVETSTTGAVVFCKITVDVKNGSGTTPNPALAALRQKVRANVISYSADASSFVVQQAE